MIIFGIDPAKETGIALWDTDKRRPVTEKYTVKDPYNMAEAVIQLRAMSFKKPDYLIIERPFFPAPTPAAVKSGKYARNLKAYETHLSIFFHWMVATWDAWKMRPRLEVKSKIRENTRARQIWPATWQAGLEFHKMKVTGKARTEYKAKGIFDLDPNYSYSSDEYDAMNLCYWQYMICRDLGIDSKSLRASGALLPTQAELELFR